VPEKAPARKLPTRGGQKNGKSAADVMEIPDDSDDEELSDVPSDLED
jgi:hypothetical protein